MTREQLDVLDNVYSELAEIEETLLETGSEDEAAQITAALQALDEVDDPEIDEVLEGTPGSDSPGAYEEESYSMD